MTVRNKILFNVIVVTVMLGLLKCSGQDICRRGKSRNIMVILPAELSFQKGAEGKLGYIENFDSQTPDFVVETVEVSLIPSKYLIDIWYS